MAPITIIVPEVWPPFLHVTWLVSKYGEEMIKTLLDRRIIWIVAIIAALFVPFVGMSQEKTTATAFAIYSTGYQAPAMKQPPIDKLPLLKQPLLTDNDIIEYRWVSHELVLSEQGLKKIQSINKHDMSGTLFVVMADGVRCYQGSFWMGILSVSYPFPVILLDDVTHPKGFTIDRAYPSAEFAKGKDPRDDIRVFNALKKVGKVK